MDISVEGARATEELVLQLGSERRIPCTRLRRQDKCRSSLCDGDIGK